MHGSVANRSRRFRRAGHRFRGARPLSASQSRASARSSSRRKRGPAGVAPPRTASRCPSLAISTSLMTTGPRPAFVLARVSGANGVRVAAFVRYRHANRGRSSGVAAALMLATSGLPASTGAPSSAVDRLRATSALSALGGSSVVSGAIPVAMRKRSSARDPEATVQRSIAIKARKPRPLAPVRFPARRFHSHLPLVTVGSSSAATWSRS